MANPFPLDEGPLRACILRAYHGRRGTTNETQKKVLEAVRQFLSGPRADEGGSARYWFEDSAAAAVPAFVADLEAARSGLSRTVLEPILAAVREREVAKSRELAPNLAVYVASLAGALAVRTGLDESLGSAAAAAALLGIARLGREPFEAALAGAE